MSYTPDILRFNGRIQRDSATAISLQEYKGNSCYVSGEYVYPGTGGISLATTDNLINSTGGDASAAMASSTLYYIYVSNSKATTFPSDLRASTTAPSLVAGVKYLGTSGNALNWRFVGWAFTNSSTQFVDTENDRLVVNYYNKRPTVVQATPGYQDDGGVDSYTHTNTSWGDANAGSGHQLSYIANGEDSVKLSLTMVVQHSDATASFWCGIGIDGSTAPLNEVIENISNAGETQNGAAAYAYTPAEGRRTAEIRVKTNLSTLTVFSDDVRDGGTKDPFMTAIFGTVMA